MQNLAFAQNVCIPQMIQTNDLRNADMESVGNGRQRVTGRDGIRRGCRCGVGYKTKTEGKTTANNSDSFSQHFLSQTPTGLVDGLAPKDSASATLQIHPRVTWVSPAPHERERSMWIRLGCAQPA